MKAIEGGETLPSLKHDRQMITAQRRLDIAISFKEFLSKYQENPPLIKKRKKISEFAIGKSSEVRVQIPNPTLRDAKREFEREHARRYSKRMIALALKEHDLNFHSYDAASPRKEKRKKNVP